jgi:hypothetical protein
LALHDFSWNVIHNLEYKKERWPALRNLNEALWLFLKILRTTLTTLLRLFRLSYLPMHSAHSLTPLPLLLVVSRSLLFVAPRGFSLPVVDCSPLFLTPTSSSLEIPGEENYNSDMHSDAYPIVISRHSCESIAIPGPYAARHAEHVYLSSRSPQRGIRLTLNAHPPILSFPAAYEVAHSVSETFRRPS